MAGKEEGGGVLWPVRRRCSVAGEEEGGGVLWPVRRREEVFCGRCLAALSTCCVFLSAMAGEWVSEAKTCNE